MLSAENMKPGKCGKSWSKSPLFGITLIFKMAVLRCHTVFSCVYKFPWKRSGQNREVFVVFRMYSCDNLLKLVRKHSPAVFKQDLKMAFLKEHTNEWFFQRIRSNFSNFEREGKFFFKASFWFIIFPWNLARLILMVKENFCWSPNWIAYWDWFYSLLKLHDIKYWKMIFSGLRHLKVSFFCTNNISVKSLFEN